MNETVAILTFLCRTHSVATRHIHVPMYLHSVYMLWLFLPSDDHSGASPTFIYDLHTSMDQTVSPFVPGLYTVFSIQHSMIVFHIFHSIFFWPHIFFLWISPLTLFLSFCSCSFAISHVSRAYIYIYNDSRYFFFFGRFDLYTSYRAK